MAAAEKVSVAIDLDEARGFLSLLDPDGIFTFQTFYDKGGRGGPVLHGTLAEHGNELIRLNQSGNGIFVMVNKGDGIIHGSAKTCRTAANVVSVRALFVDLDGAPLEPVTPYRPDIIVESSPGRWHAYWLTNQMPLPHFTPLQKQLAERFNGDPKVCDLARVMRLPGFLHQKSEPFVTRIRQLSSTESGHAR